jgi:hypothetical protein
MSSLVSQENKELLWSLLAEEGLFDGIPENVTPEEIKHVFERILKNLSATIPSLHAAKLKELHQAKRQAIADEDYDSAKKLRATIDEMEAPLARLDKLESRKQLAIQGEDFETAKQIKLEIDRIRAASFSLKELNKIAIESLAVNIPKLAREISGLKTGNRGGGFPTSPWASGGGGGEPWFNRGTGNSNPSIDAKEIYNAEDFKQQKRAELEMRKQEKEAEMRSYFEIQRPPEIDFSDTPRDPNLTLRLKSRQNTHEPVQPAALSSVVEVVHLDAPSSAAAPATGPGPGPGDDSPFRGGDDMDRLIAERIAARQRDMEEISERMKASMPPSQQQQQQQQPLPQKEYDPNEFVAQMPQQMPILLPPLPPSEETRKVRFQEDTDSIFLKLKRKPMVDEI